MKSEEKEKINILLTLSCELNEKLQREAVSQNRKRHAQIVFILERFFVPPLDAQEKKK